jgi:hypothetical protein
MAMATSAMMQGVTAGARVVHSMAPGHLVSQQNIAATSCQSNNRCGPVDVEQRRQISQSCGHSAKSYSTSAKQLGFALFKAMASLLSAAEIAAPAAAAAAVVILSSSDKFEDTDISHWYNDALTVMSLAPCKQHVLVGR